MRNTAAIIGIILLVILVMGCEKREAQTPPPVPLSDQYLIKAQEFESDGKLVEALEQYKLALTVEPQNPLALEKTSQIKSHLDGLAEEHYRTGLSFQKRGEYARAQQEFLTALRYNPGHAEAANILKEHELEGKHVKGYLVHTIQPDESISMLAQRYYGDYRKFHIIAEYNGLEDATRVTVGQRLKIPVVENLPFYARPEDIKRPSEDVSGSTLPEVLPVKGHIVHTVKPDESLSKLAIRYYGDYKKYTIIAQYNQIDENVGLKVGQKIKIPKVEGLSIAAPPSEEEPKSPEAPAPAAVEGPKQPEAPAPATEEEPKQPETPAPAPEVQKPQEEIPAEPSTPPGDQVANYRELGIELFNEKNYPEAIIEFKKILGLYSNDQMAVEYLSRSRFELGKLSFEKGEYSEAITQFETALEYDSACRECHAYINDCLNKQRDAARSRAMALFEKKQYGKAITEFEKVLQQYPDDTAALEYASAAHFQQGLVLFGQEDYLSARDEFKNSFQYNDKCDKCAEYIRKCEDTYKEIHYNRGLTYFGKERLNDAVREWELVYDLDSEYKDVSGNLKKAKELLERLESIKRSKMKE